MNIGDRYHHFIVKRLLPIEELKCTLREIIHEPSGAVVMQIANDDPENLFCLSFKTIPSNSSGVAHILEHTVLCGSKKFPVKDPFFSMTRRSLNTFMNALTGADFTCYPAASQVEKDFYNLLEVYLDAVFHPLLKKESFLQEGHRLEFTEPQNPRSPLQWKGIVYNEMKGVMSSPETRLWHEVLATLVPDLTYSHVSGGDPKFIPELSYEELIAFHNTFYHPSQCLFFFYGDLPLKKHLDFIEEHALKKVEPRPPLPSAALQRRFLKPVYKQSTYPVTEHDDLDKKTFISFSWLTAPLVDQETVLALTVLDSALMETDASPLKGALLQSGLCVSADGYIDADMTEVPYTIICKGCRATDADQLQAVLKKTLEDLARNGIPKYLIESAMHQIELARTEITGDHAPFGLTLFMRSALAKQHGCLPEHALMTHTLFNKLIDKAKNPAFWPSLLKQYFVDNAHFVRLVMEPDPKLAAQELSAETARLAQIQENLTEVEIAALLKQEHLFEQFQKQQQEQNLNCLPKVSLSDIPVLSRDYPLHIHENRFTHTCFTNGIVYADLILDLPHLDEALLPYAQILVSFLPELGVGKKGYAETLEHLQANTGGLSASLSLHVQTQDPRITKPALALRGKALDSKAKQLLLIMQEFIEDVRLDEEQRIEELLQQLHTSLQSKLNRSALKYASHLALSGLSIPAKIHQQWHGLNFVKTVEMLANTDSTQKLIHHLLQVREQLLSVPGRNLVVSAGEEIQKSLRASNYFNILSLNQRDFIPWRGDYSVSPVTSQARIIAAPVAFTCMAFPVCSYLHPHAPALHIATQIFENKILHSAIREKGGAYGCGASFIPHSGHFTLHSYRDPHLYNTITTFRDAIETVAQGNFNDQDLEEAKLGMIQQLDSPIPPGGRGIAAYSWLRDGKSKEIRQKYREALLSLSAHEVKKAVEKELLAKLGSEIIVSFAGKELLEKENSLFEKHHQKPLPIMSI